MSDPRLYVADELMGHWPFLPKSEPVAKVAGLPIESSDALVLALDAKSQPVIALAWNGSAGRISGSWHPTIGV
jgi:hypothetical protein